MKGEAIMDIAWIIIVAVLLLYIFGMVPIQYRNIVAMKEELKESKLSHNEIYEKMPFEEQQLQYNLQGNFINLPSNIIAMIIYKIRHRHE